MISAARRAFVCLLPLILWAQVKLPDGEGKDLVENVCTSCHDLDTAIDAKHTDSEWKAIVDSMAARGADATPAQFATIVKYLAKNFGKEDEKKAVAPEPGAAPALSKATPGRVILKIDAKNDWAVSGRDQGAQRFSPLTQIDAKNVSRLKLAWQYGIDPHVANLNGRTDTRRTQGSLGTDVRERTCPRHVRWPSSPPATPPGS